MKTIAHLFLIIATLSNSFLLFSISFDQAIQDVDFIFETLKENHPGTYNTEDPDFLNTLYTGYHKIKSNLCADMPDDLYIKRVTKWINSFQDKHLRINWIKNNHHINTYPKAKKSFEVCIICDPETAIIQIPTFDPNTEQLEDLHYLINELLPSLRSYKNIIFDLRGNCGGNSYWATKILETLFGKEYVAQQSNFYNKDVSIDWRASKGNIDHLQKIYTMLQSDFGPESEQANWALQVYEEMNNAYNNKQPFYTAKIPFIESKTFVTTTAAIESIFIIIDNNNASAALDFIDKAYSLDIPITLVGNTTSADSCYMEVRNEILPSNSARLVFPIKVYRNRPRGHNMAYVPNIMLDKETLQDEASYIYNLLSKN